MPEIIEGESWENVGGAGKAFAIEDSLVVVQRRSVQKEIQKLVDSLVPSLNVHGTRIPVVTPGLGGGNQIPDPVWDLEVQPPRDRQDPK